MITTSQLRNWLHTDDSETKPMEWEASMFSVQFPRAVPAHSTELLSQVSFQGLWLG